jgi:dienelactone hydrolase
MPTPTPQPTPLPAEPQTITFTAEDGAELSGLYYPADQPSAPVLVFMHWYPGDQSSWTEIAHWLQNRGVSGPGGDVPWRDSSWFPELPEDRSYAVFTFTFRGCEGGCQEARHQEWRLDARAGAGRAARLPGVDPERMIVLGASIGADGAVVGCAEFPDACRGAFSLSPGNYLGNDYQAGMQTLGSAQDPRPVWCLYDRNDHTADLCRELEGDHFTAQSYSNGYLHGMHMLNPDLAPNPLELMLDFLEEALGETNAQ